MYFEREWNLGLSTSEIVPWLSSNMLLLCESNILQRSSDIWYWCVLYPNGTSDSLQVKSSINYLQKWSQSSPVWIQYSSVTNVTVLLLVLHETMRGIVPQSKTMQQETVAWSSTKQQKNQLEIHNRKLIFATRHHQPSLHQRSHQDECSHFLLIDAFIRSLMFLPCKHTTCTINTDTMFFLGFAICWHRSPTTDKESCLITTETYVKQPIADWSSVMLKRFLLSAILLNHLPGSIDAVMGLQQPTNFFNLRVRDALWLIASTPCFYFAWLTWQDNTELCLDLSYQNIHSIFSSLLWKINFIWSCQQIANVYRYNYQTFCVKNVNRFKVDARIRIILNIFWKDLWSNDWWFCSSTGLHTSDTLHILDIHLVNLQIDLIGDCKNKTNRVIFCHGCKYFLIVYARL